MTLHELGLKYGTDKATFHNFCELYDEHLTPYKNIKKMLEIGIYRGESLLMWKEYFPEALIVGADINRYNINEDRIKTICINQENESDLLSLDNDFDFIIDDGGHTMLQQQLTLKVCVDKLKSGGIYILEDLHTSNWLQYGATLFNNTIRLLEELKEGTMSDKSKFYINKEDFDYLKAQFKSIEIFDIKGNKESITAILIKK